MWDLSICYMLGRTSRCSPARPCFVRTLLYNSWSLSLVLSYLSSQFQVFLLPSGIIHSVHYNSLHTSLHLHIIFPYTPSYTHISPRTLLLYPKPTQFPSSSFQYHPQFLPFLQYHPINRPNPNFLRLRRSATYLKSFGHNRCDFLRVLLLILVVKANPLFYLHTLY